MNNKKQPNRPQKKGGAPKFNPMWIYGAIGGGLLFLFVTGNFFTPSIKKIDEYKFFSIVEKDYVKKIEIHQESNLVEVYLKKEALQQEELAKYKSEPSGNPFNPLAPNMSFSILSEDNFSKKLDDVKANNDLDFTTSVTRPNPMFEILLNIFIWLAIFGLIWFFLFRRIAGGGAGGGGQIFNIGKSKAKLFDENDKVKVSFKDVAGLEGAKEEVQEIVDFLKNPEKYTKLGGKIPKGALLIGPPGTGKTLLAKAVAGEAKVPFFSLSGSDFVEMFVGVGASRVRDLFKQAKDKSPAIIFIDEIDAIGRARGKNNMTGANDERENTLNQLLTEMDGFGTNTNVIVMAATNRVDVLDKALLRAGRFDRRINVDLPELNERKEIFAVHLRPIKTDSEVEVDFLAKQTPGFSGADIANICNESALVAARKGKNLVGKQDFLDAVDRIIGGLEKRSKIIKPSEKRRIAIHEAGHATVSWLLEYAAPLVKVTIVPRGQSLGAAWYLPEERQITTSAQMYDEMCATLGGRAAEEVEFGTKNYSTGALSDLEKVTKQAQAMVAIYGLNDRVGHISYYDSTGQNDYGFSKPYSEKTAQIIDEEVKALSDVQYKRAYDLLSENKDKLLALADKLLEKEVIFTDDLEAIFGKRPFTVEEAIASKKPEEASPNLATKTEGLESEDSETDSGEERLSSEA